MGSAPWLGGWVWEGEGVRTLGGGAAGGGVVGWGFYVLSHFGGFLFGSVDNGERMVKEK